MLSASYPDVCSYLLTPPAIKYPARLTGGQAKSKQKL